jgi:hypothetical protein
MNAAEHESNQPATATTEAEARPKKRGFLKFPRSWAEVKKMGWKFIVAFILFYLIRDTLLYILLPYLIYKGVISF